MKRLWCRKSEIYIHIQYTFRQKQKYDKKIDNILVFACITECRTNIYPPVDIAVIRVQIYIRTDHMHLAAKASPWHRHPRVIQTQQISKNDTWFQSISRQESILFRLGRTVSQSRNPREVWHRASFFLGIAAMPVLLASSPILVW